MSYSRAKDFFQDNIQRLGGPQKDPLFWNLNGGLLELVKGLEDESRQIRVVS